jgi:hypothetical protein
MTILFFQTVTITDIISSIAAITALVTAYITYLTVKEIKKQREHSYHPDVNISNFDFYIYRADNDFDDEEENPNALYLFYSKERLGESEPKKGYNDLKIEIHNIGFGVAKFITYEWKFDFEIAKERLKAVNNSCELEINEEYISVDLKDYDVSWTFDLYEESLSEFINFILPYSTENRKTEIRLPSYFIDLFWLYMVGGISKNEFYDPDDFPPLHLIMNYTNIHGKKVEKEFLLYLKFDFFSNPQNSKKELAKFRFEILENNNK